MYGWLTADLLGLSNYLLVSNMASMDFPLSMILTGTPILLSTFSNRSRIVIVILAIHKIKLIKRYLEDQSSTSELLSPNISPKLANAS